MRDKNTRFKMTITLLITLAISTATIAEIPDGYYDSIDVSSPLSLHQSLHEIIDDHRRFPYTSSATDTWDILEQADQDPNNVNNVLDVYHNASYVKQGGGNNAYNREHSWPKSYGFPKDSASNYPYSDTHQLFISDSRYNSSRGNKPYANCSTSCSERETLYNNFRGGTAVESNWTEGSGPSGKWETWSGRKGDVARAIMYMAVRYEGGKHGQTGVSEPDLRLTNDRNLIARSNTGSNGSVAYMGIKSVLLEWHASDPVDAQERARNDVIYSYQGNRNPFIDHPEFVLCVFDNDCSHLDNGGGDSIAPSAPTGLKATGGQQQIALSWESNTEADLAGYHIYRQVVGESSPVRISDELITETSYLDAGLLASTSYEYWISATDTSNNESELSLAASATTGPDATFDADAWINELHYDNQGGDLEEGVEIAGAAGTDLTNWQLVFYNGNGGKVYQTVDLYGAIPNQESGFGSLWFEIPNIQNGSQDGIALINPVAEVIQFLSYEGELTAADGPAEGQKSVDIGVRESGSSALGTSLQLGGTGRQYSDFTWQSSLASTYGAINENQSFVAPIDSIHPSAPSRLMATSVELAVELSWNDNQESDLAGYNVYQSTDGMNFTQFNTRVLADSALTISDLSPSIIYYFFVTAIDLVGNESEGSEIIEVAVSDLPDNEAPMAPEFLEIAIRGLTAKLNWAENTESDVLGYNVYRFIDGVSEPVKMNDSLVTDTKFSNRFPSPFKQYTYYVTAVDVAGNESSSSALVETRTTIGGIIGWFWSLIFKG